MKIHNLGEEDIAKANAVIDILGPTNEKIATIESNVISLKSGKRGELYAVYKNGLKPGKYHAIAHVRYDTQVATTETNFGVGEMFVEIKNIDVKDFRLGSVAKFDIRIENKWNEELKDVYGRMQIWDEDDNLVADFKTASIDLQPFETTTIYGYWDTEGISVGTYEAKLTLYYANKTTERMLKTNVKLSSIEIDIIGVGMGAVTVKERPEEIDNYIIILIIVLVVANMGWFYYFRRSKKIK